jgi:muconate cycloisomerase
MRIKQINIYQIRLPFVGDFSHAQKKGAFAQNILVEILTDSKNIRGYGEGAPRLYVTGESPQTAINAVRRLVRKPHFPWELEDIAQIWNLIDRLPKTKAYNSAVCALEMALLDTLGKIENREIMSFFSPAHFTETIHYGAAVHLGEKENTIKICRIIQRLGIQHLRVKLNGDINRNQQTLETVLSTLEDVDDLRVDINGAWNKESAFRHIPLIKTYPIIIVEQPMRPKDPDLPEFAAVMKSAGIVLMADESACSLIDVENILQDGDYGMVNVRLSKCGGFRRSLQIIALLRSKGIPFQIGCQLGESGLLSSAGRALSLLNRDALYYDGSYDAFLLEENLTEENVSFGAGGIAGPISGPGLGLNVDPRQISRLNTGLISDSILKT